MKKSTYFSLVLMLLFAAGTATSAFAVKHIVHVGNFYFTPATINNVSVGDTMRWVWDNGSHTTTSTTIPGGAASWDEIINSSNTVYEYKVTVAGVYNYVCTPHAGMGQVGSFTASGAAPTLTLSPSNRNVSASAGSTTFTVTSNSSWTASSNANWCTVTPSGSGNGTITANYTENTSTSQRVATITVNVTGLPAQTVTVTQAGAPLTLTVTPPNQDVTFSDGSTSFSVTSNTNWTATSGASWCTVTPSGSGNGTISAQFTENPTALPRVAEITVTVAGLPSVIVTVSQDGSTVSVAENQDLNFSIYPNPTQGAFKVSSDEFSKGNGNITILDLNGKTVVSQEIDGSRECRFDLSTQPQGFYFIRVKSGDASSVRRLIITR
jgi:plastocyanin